MNFIETPRLYLRQWVSEDWLLFRKLATDPRVVKYIGDSQIWSDERIRKFVDSGIEAEKSRGWILWPVMHKADADMIGICGFNNGYAPEIEIGWWLRPEYWNQGLATEIARQVAAYGFEKFKFPRLISVAYRENKPSIRVMQKIGMNFEREMNKEGRDLVVYSMSAEEFAASRA